MNSTSVWQIHPAATAMLAALHRAPAAASLQQAALAVVLAAEAMLFLLSINDIPASLVLFKSAARCWPGRFGGRR